jgi:hypothetical protein
MAPETPGVKLLKIQQTGAKYCQAYFGHIGQPEFYQSGLTAE